METTRAINFSGGDGETGFRLERLEVFNWGTFHGVVHVLKMGGLAALLTGPNGSGKSTLVDALLTLLVPQRMGRNYNMAAGARRKKERTEKTYIQGVWAEGLISEGSAAVEPKRLRPTPGTPSVLLAVFRNRVTAQTVTIAQVLWMVAGEDVEHVFVVTNDERSIAGDFRDLGDTRKLRQTLTKRGMEPLPSFDAYAEAFCRRVHLAYPSGLSLFNTVVSIKETGDIAEFIRHHMLARYDEVDGLLAQAHQQLEDLEQCSNEIASAERQRELLQPIAKVAEDLALARTALSQVDKFQDDWPLYVAYVVAGQARARLAAIDAEQAELNAQLDAIKEKRGLAMAERDEVVKARAGRPAAMMLAELENRIAEAGKRRAQKEASQALFEKTLRDLNMREPFSSDGQFRALRDRLSKKQAAEEGAFENAIARKTELLRQAEVKRSEQSERVREVARLRSQQSHIRSDLAGIRERIARATNIPPGRLPFAGELIQVRPDQLEWREVLEILMGRFGRAMLVEASDYRAVVEFVHQNNLHGRLDFNRVDEVPTAAADPKPVDQGRVMGLLAIRPDHPLRGWVAEEVRRRFSHACCATTEEFRKTEYAVMSSRLIRNGQSRHTKDDRPQAIDPEQFVLGWNNEELLRTIQTRAQALGEQAQKLEDQARRTETAKQTSDDILARLDRLLRFERFDEVNPEPDLVLQREAEAAKLKLEAGDVKLRELDEALKKVNGRLGGLANDEAQAQGFLGAITKERDQVEKQRSAMDARPAAPAGTDFETTGEQVRPFLGKLVITLADAAQTESTVANTLRLEARKRQDAVSRKQGELTRAMTAFLDEFLQLRSDYSTDPAKVSDYLTLMRHIEKEKLPDLRERFKRLMNERVVQNMALLQNKLDESVRDYQTAIAGLNLSLKDIEYSSGTFIQIAALHARGALVNGFRRDLKECLPGATVPTDESRQKAFEQIRAVLTRLRQDDRWRNDVTDTRNWLDFRVDEVSRETSAIVNNYSSSESKSGGQKAKLAFTVMAAAIAHQYGLLHRNAEEKSFRFVVIDEIFGKTDEANSIYALRLFQKFKLQLLVVCPFTAQARVVDEFVGSYHLTSNPEWSNSSLLTASLEQLTEAAERGAVS